MNTEIGKGPAGAPASLTNSAHKRFVLLQTSQPPTHRMILRLEYVFARYPAWRPPATQPVKPVRLLASRLSAPTPLSTRTRILQPELKATGSPAVALGVRTLASHRVTESWTVAVFRCSAWMGLVVSMPRPASKQPAQQIQPIRPRSNRRW